ncbi:MAG: double-strand break repair protein AddB [Limimaricola sp.]|uniref:double-strand break repair protein AddB n=1 Tax=Limimaricola sp. TaxID=2211665 RepID=UPI001D773861|nr:double-strand break repair protein AddB [Limimaricola sp.]MBI1417235.1 double-strand break repair protein AddB [Limimaricola sp.]
MAEPVATPQVFALPPGVDFAARVVDGIVTRFGSDAPDALARVEVLVNTRRMQRRMTALFAAGPARLLPRIRVVVDVALDPVVADVPLPVPPLRRRLELAQLVARLIDHFPDIAPRAATFDLADGLANLMAEMGAEGVDPATIGRLDVTDLSGHWDRTRQFLDLVGRYQDMAEGPEEEARLRLAVERLAARWADRPPPHPVIVAGSTGSRGPTALLMAAVARLPKGLLVLPGFDFDLPPAVWERLDDPLTGEDHPQFRFARLMTALGIGPDAVRRWDEAQPASPARNRLVSLALRPAPVTDQWLSEGRDLTDVADATAKLSLIEAPTQHDEAETIALRLRQAVEDRQTAALITPDRMLTRQVAAALDRWGIVPDDSAGQPLGLTPPGRFLRHLAQWLAAPPDAEALLVVLKHPLAHSSAARGNHLRHARDLELALRGERPPPLNAAGLHDWAKTSARDDADRQAWANWVLGALELGRIAGKQSLTRLVELHLELAHWLASGPGHKDGGALWDEATGRKAREICDDLARHADAGGEIDPGDYPPLFEGILAGQEVRNPTGGHPRVLIWGTLEARVQGADLVILGGLNDGVWPALPEADPWLNRKMRAEAGLLLPERRIGLSAHDFQQAIAAPEVWLTRSLRMDEAAAVPSRWLNRLTNLMEGLPENGGPAALNAMRDRGARWVAMAAKLGQPTARTAPALRPSPCPPVAARPRRLSVTQVETLIRDPYAIYAREVLRLRQLGPLVAQPDAPFRGIVLHKILEVFSGEGLPATAPGTRERLMEIAREVLDALCPWPAMRHLWWARLDRVADWFLEGEAARQTRGNIAAREVMGELRLDSVDFLLRGKADRIDRCADGRVILYDYKTGTVPSAKQQAKFSKQLLLEAAMVAEGAFDTIGPAEAAAAEFIGLGASPSIVAAPLENEPPAEVLQRFIGLIRKWDNPARGYTARMALFQRGEVSRYDHLSRFGEWDQTADPAPEVLR